MLESLNASCLCNVIDRLAIGVVVLDSERRILFWNNWLATHSGLSSKAACGRTLADIWPAAGEGRLALAIDHAIRDSLPSLLSPALHGTLLPLYADASARASERRIQQMSHVLPVREQDNPAACLIQISDVTANISRERLFRQQADTLRRSNTHDALTGLPNRAQFDESLAVEFQKAQRSGKSLAMVIADIDFFNDYNIRHGRDQGDQALTALARAFRKIVSPLGDTVARLSGNAFAFLLPRRNAEDAIALAGEIRRHIEAEAIAHTASPISKHLTISVGAAVMTPDAEADTHTLVSSADVALYQAKHEGRNRAVYFAIEDGSFTACP